MNLPNYNMIILARESKGLSQKDLAVALDIPQGKLSKIENGIQPADQELISQIADLLSFKEGFFYEESKLIQTGFTFNRAKSKLSSKIHNKIQADGRIKLFCLEKLLNSIELEENIPFKRLETYDTPEEKARALRSFWHIPHGPIDNLVKVVEKAGIVVIMNDFKTSDFDGFYIDHECKTIFLNKSFPGDRLRFSLAHELGHLLMHSIPTDNTEDEANRFASELLMPEDDIKKYFMAYKRHNLNCFADLKPIWKCSMAALAFRAKTLGYLSPDGYKRFNIEMGKRGYRTNEPLYISPEQPSLYQRFINAHIEEYDYSLEDFENLFHQPLSPLEMYGDSQPGLKLVNI